MEEMAATGKEAVEDEELPPAQLPLYTGVRIEGKRGRTLEAKRLTQASKHGPLGL